jgi:hypothetical protein
MKLGHQLMCSQCGNVVLAFVVNKWYDYAVFDWDAETYCEKCMGKYKYKPKDSNSTNTSMNVSNTDKNNEKK